MQPAFRIVPASALAFLLMVFGASQGAEPKKDPLPVSRQIDREIDKRLEAAKTKPSPVSSDVEFLRRAYLDITGRIPTAEKAAAFLDSNNPDKRRLLIDELLVSPGYGNHFGITWRNAIYKRDEDNKDLATKPFTDWLAKNFNQNRGWNEIVSDMLTAEGSTQDNPQGFFFMATRDMGKMSAAKVIATTTALFMGNQMQCAECHNHPFTKTWKQTDFWGMAAFFGRVRDAGAKGKQISQTGAIIDEGGRGNPGFIAIPSPIDAKKTIGVAKAKYFMEEEASLGKGGAYRSSFASWLTSPENKHFANSAVNRLWAHFFARGLVHPIEYYNDENPPSHPELLKLLAKEFTASGYDQKHLIRCICNSAAYQRTSKPLPDNEDAGPELFSRMAVKVMSADMLFDSLVLATGAKDPDARETGGGGKKGKRSASSPRQQFINFFDNDSEDPTELGLGIPQFLRLMNSPEFNSREALVDRLAAKGRSEEKVMEGLFLATLSRRPTPAELKKFSAYVAKQGDAKKGYAGALWVLLNCAEFVCIR